MSIVQMKQVPVSLADGAKRDVRTQFGALCFRVKNDKVQVLLVTSRGTGRWIIPKGWPMDGETPAAAAKTEAFEEAGAEGKIFQGCLGIYSYTKGLSGEPDLPCVVAVFPMKVKRLSKDYPEMDERNRKWFSQKKAAKLVDERELRQIIANFDPKQLA